MPAKKKKKKKKNVDNCRDYPAHLTSTVYDYQGGWDVSFLKYHRCILLHTIAACKKLHPRATSNVFKYLPYWLIDYSFIVLHPFQEYFTYVEMSPLPVKGCKKAYARRPGPLSREGSLSCNTCCDTGPRFFRSHPKERPIKSPLTTHGDVEDLF